MPKVTLQEGIKKDSHTISITVCHELYKKISYYAIEKDFSRPGAVKDIVEKTLSDYGLTQAGAGK